MYILLHVRHSCKDQNNISLSSICQLTGVLLDYFCTNYLSQDGWHFLYFSIFQAEGKDVLLTPGCCFQPIWGQFTEWRVLAKQEAEWNQGDNGSFSQSGWYRPLPKQLQTWGEGLRDGGRGRGWWNRRWVRYGAARIARQSFLTNANAVENSSVGSKQCVPASDCLFFLPPK